MSGKSLSKMFFLLLAVVLLGEYVMSFQLTMIVVMILIVGMLFAGSKG